MVNCTTDVNLRQFQSIRMICVGKRKYATSMKLPGDLQKYGQRITRQWKMSGLQCLVSVLGSHAARLADNQCHWKCVGSNVGQPDTELCQVNTQPSRSFAWLWGIRKKNECYVHDHAAFVHTVVPSIPGTAAAVFKEHLLLAQNKFAVKFQHNSMLVKSYQLSSELAHLIRNGNEHQMKLWWCCSWRQTKQSSRRRNLALQNVNTAEWWFCW